MAVPVIGALIERFRGPTAADPVATLEAEVQNLTALVRGYELEEGRDGEYVQVTERIAELELALDELGWTRMISEAGYTVFTRQALNRIISLSRIMYLKNPLVNRLVEVQKIYCWAMGWNVKAEHPIINDIVQEFLDDKKNQAELTSQQQLEAKEVELQLAGNLFFVFFVNKLTGLVRVRSIIADEIDDIITNPDDNKEPWLYKRMYLSNEFNVEGGTTSPKQVTAWYPDWRFQPRTGEGTTEAEQKLATKPGKIGSADVHWETPIYHVKVGGLPHHKFGVPETYQALDWARATKEHLEDWVTVWRALSQFAMTLKTTRGSRGVADAKTKLGTTIGLGPQNSFLETNPASLRASTFIGTQGVDIEPFKTQGARNNPEEARMLIRMVASSAGLPETFFGDADVGNHATSKTLDRPTELKMRSRQALWRDIFESIFQFVIDCHGKATAGLVQGREITDARSGDKKVELELDPDTREPISRHLDIMMPDILDHDVGDKISAIVNATTLGGHPNAGILPTRQVAVMLLSELGVDDIDEEIEKMFPEEEDLTDPLGIPAPADGQDPEDTEEALREAYWILRSAIRGAGPEMLGLMQAAAKNHNSSKNGHEVVSV